MPIKQHEATSAEAIEGSDFEKSLAKYYALLEHSDADDVKLFFYGELTQLLENKLAKERQLRQAAEKEVDRLRAAADNKPDIKVRIKDEPFQSEESPEATRQSESLKAEVQRAWSVAAMIEENLCKKEIELDRKEQKVRELKEKLAFAVHQSRAAANSLRENYQNLVNIPPIVEQPNFTAKQIPINRVRPISVIDTPMPRLEHPTKRVKLEHLAKPAEGSKNETPIERKTVELPMSVENTKVEYRAPMKKIEIKNCTKRARENPPLVALQGIPNNQPTENVYNFRSSEKTNSVSLRQSPSKTSCKRGPLLKKKRKTKKAKKEREPYKPMFIFCIHCKKTRQLLPRKDGSGFTFRHTCPMDPTAKRVTQSLKYKVTTCKLDHEGPCARLATAEEMKTCKRKFHGQGQKQTHAEKKKTVTT